MLINFFSDLAKILERSLTTKTEQITEMFKRAALPISTVIGKKDEVEGILSIFQSADLEELRKRLEEMLIKEGRRVVILIDDIDRLEKEEVHAVFRLVKLTADFKNTAYILAFDKEMVSSVLQERYGSNNFQAGELFLEKIIQVPLKLPTVEKSLLLDLCIENINITLQNINFSLRQSDLNQFSKVFIDHMQRQLKTPRQIVIYCNILSFSLPLLKNEANLVDLLLIEAVRVFYPNVYKFICDNQEIVLQSGISHLFTRKEDYNEATKVKIHKYLEMYSIEEIKDIEELLVYMFPQLGSILNKHAIVINYDSFTKNQRICSNIYFSRYFTYSVSSRSISDQVITEIINLANSDGITNTEHLFTKSISTENIEEFISKLGLRYRELSYTGSLTLSELLARQSINLPRDRGFLMGSSFDRAGMLINKLISETLKDKDEYIKHIGLMIRNVSYLEFALIILRWTIRDTEERPDPNGLNKEDLKKLSQTLAIRVAEELINEEISSIFKKKELIGLLNIWRIYGNETDAKSFLEEILKDRPEEVINLIKRILGIVYSDAPTSIRELHIDEYNNLKEMVSPIFLIEELEKKFGVQMHVDKYLYFEPEVPIDLRLAQQLYYLYNQQNSSN